MRHFRIKQTRKQTNRVGVAVTELAVCLPILIILVLGTIETCSMLNLKKSIAIAGYEGARVALIAGANDSNVLAQVDQILDERRVKNATVSVTPSVASAASGTFIKVSISVPCEGNGPLSSLFFKGRRLERSVEMMKEL